MKRIPVKIFLYSFLLCIIVSSLSACIEQKQSIHLSNIQDTITEIIEEHYLQPCPPGRISVYSYTVLNDETTPHSLIS